MRYLVGGQNVVETSDLTDRLLTNSNINEVAAGGQQLRRHTKKGSDTPV